MELNQTIMKPKISAKDFFLNLGAIVALYTLVVSLFNLLTTVIDKAYPPITSYFNPSISWPVATLIIFYPIFILLMWLLEREYRTEPERQSTGVHKWLTFLTLFLSGLTIAGDLIMLLYKFIDGQDLTTGFVLKVSALLVIAVSVFTYYLSDVRGKLTAKSRIFWRVLSVVVIVGAIVWGFAVLGSPATQRLYKYDSEKVSDLMNIDNAVRAYWQNSGALPKSLNEPLAYEGLIIIDSQTKKSYEYKIVSDKKFELCAEFNKTSNSSGTNARYPVGVYSWQHNAGRVCFTQTINPAQYPSTKPLNL